MFNWLRRLRVGFPKATKGKAMDLLADSATQLQCAYWTYDVDEKAELLSRYPGSLSWAELLRLHHLACLALSNTDEGQVQLMSDKLEIGNRYEAPEGPAYNLCKGLAERLLSKESPYKARHCVIWKGQSGQTPQSPPPDFQGRMRNASLTHLGCMEVIHLDEDNHPSSLSFVPFDDIRGVMFTASGLFRPAKILYEDSRQEEIVLIPLLYGVSWFISDQFYRDGTLTRFYCHLPVEGLAMQVGIGVGHQDLLLTKPDGNVQSLMGLGSVSEIMVALSVDDPRFEQKCRARGLDPAYVKQEFQSDSI